MVKLAFSGVNFACLATRRGSLGTSSSLAVPGELGGVATLALLPGELGAVTRSYILLMGSSRSRAALYAGSGSAGADALRSRLTCMAFFVSGSTVAVALRSRFTGLTFSRTGTSGSSSEELYGVSGPRTSLYDSSGVGSDIAFVVMVLMARDLPSPLLSEVMKKKVKKSECTPTFTCLK